MNCFKQTVENFAITVENVKETAVPYSKIETSEDSYYLNTHFREEMVMITATDMRILIIYMIFIENGNCPFLWRKILSTFDKVRRWIIKTV